MQLKIYRLRTSTTTTKHACLTIQSEKSNLSKGIKVPRVVVPSLKLALCIVVILEGRSEGAYYNRTKQGWIDGAQLLVSIHLLPILKKQEGKKLLSWIILAHM